MLKSIQIAGLAIAATAATLSGFSMIFAAPQNLIGKSFDSAIAAAPAKAGSNLATAARAPGSEHFWLTQPANTEAVGLSPASAIGDAASVAELQQAIATASTLDAGDVQIIDVQTVARTSLNEASTLGRALLVTAKVNRGSLGPDRVVRVVIDITPAASGKSARVL